MKRLACAVGFALVLASAGSARAQDAAAAGAEALFVDAQHAMERGEYEVAAQKLEKSLELSFGLGALLNLAVCHEKLGRSATAWTEFSRAASRAAASGDEDRERFAVERANDLAKRLSRVTFRTPAGLSLKEVIVDGQTLAAAALVVALPLDPGRHTLVFVADGFKPAEKTIDVPQGPSATTVDVPQLEPIAAEPVALPPAVETPAPPRSSTATVAGFSLLVVAAAGIAVGTPFGLRAIAKKGEMDDLCTGNACTDAGFTARDDAYSAATVSTVAFVVAGAALVAGTYLLLSRPSAAKTSAVRAPFVGWRW